MHRCEKWRIVAARVEQARRLPDGFASRVTGDAGEGLVDPKNHALGIGNEHALLCLKSNGGNAQVGIGRLGTQGELREFVLRDFLLHQKLGEGL